MFTGITRYRGEHRTRKQLVDDIKQRGGSPQKGTRNSFSTVLVLGGLHSDVVVDARGGRSQSLVYVDTQAARGNHICIIDDAGYEALLNGKAAPCIAHRRLSRL
jgi:hypothetical protein